MKAEEYLWLKVQSDFNPNGTALISENGELTFRHLDEKATRTAALLSERGIRKGSHVAIIAKNSERCFHIIHALMLLQAVIVPINIRLTSTEISHQIEFADCSFVITDDEINSTGRKETQSDNDTMLLIFTSGSSGYPKCVEISAMQIFYNAIGTKLRLQINGDDSWLLSLPLYHIGGISVLFRSVIFGIPVIIPSGLQDHLISAIIEYDPSIVSLVPTMMYRINQTGVKPNPAHKMILLGGGAIGEDLIKQSREAGWRIAATYGSTETCSQIATLHPLDTRYPESAGQPIPFNKLYIVDESGKDLPPGSEGEITVESPSVMKGYYKRADLTNEKIRDGRYFTGDYGTLNAENYLHIISRRSDLIVSGGENINPVEVEEVIRRHPAISDVCVFPSSDDEWGEIVAAAIVVNDDTVTVNTIKEFLSENIAPYKLPKRFFIVKQLPDTEHGKRNRRSFGEQITGKLG